MKKVPFYIFFLLFLALVSCGEHICVEHEKAVRINTDGIKGGYLPSSNESDAFGIISGDTLSLIYEGDTLIRDYFISGNFESSLSPHPSRYSGKYYLGNKTDNIKFPTQITIHVDGHISWYHEWNEKNDPNADSTTFFSFTDTIEIIASKNYFLHYTISPNTFSMWCTEHLCHTEENSSNECIDYSDP